MQAIGYEVTLQEWNRNRILDMIATISEGTIYQKVLVRCIEGEITGKDVENVDEKLDRKIPQAWLISDRRISCKARENSQRDQSIQVFNLVEFLQQKIWKNYIEKVNKVVNDSKIPELYVDINCCKKEIGEDEGQVISNGEGNLIDYIDNWLRERGKIHISLLGDFGSGKTWFCRYYTHRQLQRYLKNPSNERFPLLITLRDFVKSTTVQRLINDALLEQYELPFIGGAYKVFQDMNRNGRLLLILDGFDEMARKADYQTVVDNFRNLAELVSENNKIILTSRTEYFRWAKEAEEIFGGKKYGRKTIMLTGPEFEMVYLEQFSDKQIREVIVKKYGEINGRLKADRILNINNLAEMARKPVLIELLLAALEEVDEDKLTNVAQVYLYATNKLLLRNIAEERTFTSIKDKLFFLCELAWEMINSGELKIHYKQFSEKIKDYFNEKIKDIHELDNWDYDLHSQTLLHSNLAGYYEFAHKSLAEYFVAYKFASELGCLSNEFKNAYCDLDDSNCEPAYLTKDIIELADTFGLITFEDINGGITIAEFMKEMITDDSEDMLWNIVMDTKDKNANELQFVGSNAIELLKKLKTNFVERDLSHVILPSVNFCELDLKGSNFNGANLVEANFTCSLLDEVNFNSADLLKADFTLASLSNVNFSYSNLESVIIDDSVANDINWSDNNELAISDNFSQIAIYNSSGDMQVFKTFDKQLVIKYILWDKYSNNIIFSEGTNIYIWNTDKLKVEKSITIAENMINGIYISPSGRYISTTHGKSGNIRIWDCMSFDEIKKINIGTGWCNGAIFLKDDAHILSTGYEGEIKMWSIENEESILLYKINEASNAYSLRLVQNEKKIAVIASQKELKGKQQSIIYSYPKFDVIQNIIFEEKDGNRRIICHDVSLDGKKFAIIVREDNELKLKLGRLDKDNYELIDLFKFEDDTDIEYRSATGNDIKFSADGCKLAIRLYGHVGIWCTDYEKGTFGECLKHIELTIKCNGVNITGAKGLSNSITWIEKFKFREGTLRDFFIERGGFEQ